MLRRFLSVVLAMVAVGHPSAFAVAANCERDSTGLVPLTDLGAGTHHGFEGGLYRGGSNHRPAAHDAAGAAIANAIVPLDTLGNPDVGGRIVLISIGMSNATQEFSSFVPRAMNDPARHPRLLVIDCAQGGQAASDISVPAAAYWDTVAARLRGRGSSPLQAQVAWIKQANRRPIGPFPATAESLMWNLGSIVRILKQKLPNVRLAYFTSRIYAGYASTALNPEPYAYESGFAVKWLIEGQIDGADSLNFDPDSGPVEAPWLSWGPYLWADGLEGRGDGMVWRCENFSSDGTHPSASGRSIVADSLLAFFKSDETTVPWFTSPTVSAPRPAPGEDLRIALAPNPARGAVSVSFVPRAGQPWRLEVLDLFGRQVRDLGGGMGTGESVVRRWDGRDGAGDRVRAGVFWMRLTSGAARSTRRLVALGPD